MSTSDAKVVTLTKPVEVRVLGVWAASTPRQHAANLPSRWQLDELQGVRRRVASASRRNEQPAWHIEPTKGPVSCGHDIVVTLRSAQPSCSQAFVLYASQRELVVSGAQFERKRDEAREDGPIPDGPNHLEDPRVFQRSGRGARDPRAPELLGDQTMCLHGKDLGRVGGHRYYDLLINHTAISDCEYAASCGGDPSGMRRVSRGLVQGYTPTDT
jgi:hypothetical protein